MKPSRRACHRTAGTVLVAVLLFPSATALAQDAPKGPLSGRAVENLAAYARLLSLIRFFHPSDEAAAADWKRVAVAGVGVAEPAGDPAALARSLEAFFRPLAPTLRVYPQGAKPEMPMALRPPASGEPVKIVAWRHFGGKFDGHSKVFASERIDDHVPPGFGTLVQAAAPGPLRGKRVRLSASIRAEVQPGSYAQLGLRVDRAGGQRGFFDNMADRPIRDASWRTYVIEGEVAPDAERIVILLVLTGAGRAWLDDVSLVPVEGSDNSTLVNGGFEEGETGRQPPSWLFPYESVRAGYHLLLRRGEPCLRGGCAEVASDSIATPRFVRPADTLDVDLGGGVAAAVPVTLYADVRGTLPHAAPGIAAPPWQSTNAGDTRDARLAAVALAWGIGQHLHPELDPAQEDWVAAL